MLTCRAFLLLLLLFLTISTTIGTRIPLTHTNSPTTRRHLANFYHHTAYYVTLGVGTPPQSQDLFIDTDNNLLYDNILVCNVSTAVCTYDYGYSGGLHTQRTMALESVMVRDLVVPDRVPVGCAHVANFMANFTVNGVLGLAGGSLSLASQSSGTLGGAFSYCLSYTSKFSSYYYIGLTGLGVDGVRVDGINEMIFRMSDEEDRGMIVDTGMTVTMLPAEAYIKLWDVFIKAMGNVTTRSSHNMCYQLDETERIPNITLFFSHGPSLTTKHPLYGLYNCFAFAPLESDQSPSVIVNVAQQGTRILVTIHNPFRKLSPTQMIHSRPGHTSKKDIRRKADPILDGFIDPQQNKFPHLQQPF
ncbi:Unknown protein [Striga hermonthica]|uniref:Xylanase inhibitor N-terminal domain-containing protein n=1 Tax=Striga hermonthica TaxID=68872 RepID=A0A9N7N5H1_STRHE|nr:Unknown protein [Striga hermonthica]